MLRVGLTGGIASGKSTVARRLTSLGAVVVDADELAREVVAPGSEGLAEVVDVFGAEVLAPDGGLDRPALGRLVFTDQAARSRLEQITHPRIRALTDERFGAAAEDAVVVHDVPLLVELGYEDRYHLTVVVHADEQERIRRLVVERGSSGEDARRRIAAQADDERRRAAADVWLDNTAGTDELLQVVDTLWRERLVPYEHNVRARRAVPAPLRVDLVEPQPRWAAEGRRLAARVRAAAGEAVVATDHVGPTAVPGLAAEDVVDLQLVLPDLATADGLADTLAAAGFPRVDGDRRDTSGPGEHPADASDQRRHGSADPGRPVRLHVRAAGSPGARHAWLLRDWLRADAEARRDYEAEQRRRALLHPLRSDHSRAEEPWLTDVAWPRMRRWAEATGWKPPA